MALATELMKINNFRTKLKSTLKTKIIIWFIVITLISLILYGLLVFYLLRFDIQNKRHLQELKNNPDIDRMMIENIERINKRPREFIFLPPLTVLPPHLIIRVFLILSGGVLAIIIISTSGGFLFLKRSLDQIEFITNSVKEIDEKRLHIRLNLKGKDAISKMAATFDSMLDKIENSFIHQKQFIQNASHELNTPLTIIKTNIDVLKQDKNATKKDYIETIELVNDEVSRLSRITDDLLLLSSLDDINKQKQFKQIDIKKITEKVLLLFKNKIKSKNLILLKNFQGNFHISGNEELIEQLIFNLIDNAIKYSDANKKLEINISNDIEKQNLIFEIKNESSIIQEEDMPYLFDRFFKVRNEKVVSSKKEGITVNDARGYGLGLSICKKIVEIHNGKISVGFDNLKKVISFKIILPLFSNK